MIRKQGKVIPWISKTPIVLKQNKNAKTTKV